ncbi:hypothetical protein CC80DRAFT_82415 [Byssothecium circinans]|uniref:Uncharacterized protein n=1 Tax=Byssothecium circinans TaxID=147558 RepID=A0A6A5TSL8_9PLEO|nr:hypothetical protein CC80DRAFT_82415 [Byssothecium circinans]
MLHFLTQKMVALPSLCKNARASNISPDLPVPFSICDKARKLRQSVQPVADFVARRKCNIRWMRLKSHLYTRIPLYRPCANWPHQQSVTPALIIGTSCLSSTLSSPSSSLQTRRRQVPTVSPTSVSKPVSISSRRTNTASNTCLRAACTWFHHLQCHTTVLPRKRGRDHS